MAPRPGRETVGGQSTVAEPPPWERAQPAAADLGARRGRRDRPRAHRPAPHRRRAPLRGLPRLGRAPPRRARGEGPAARPGRRTRPRCATSSARATCWRGSPTPSSCAASAPRRGGPFPHLLLEHLEGPTLQALLDRHGPDRPRAAAAARDARRASALHYLAHEGVVHLDVKPDNLVMGAPPRLIDFSVSRGLISAARLSKPVGTDAYMAPEQCDRTRGAARPGGRRVRARRDDVPRDDRRAGVPARPRAPRARPTWRSASRSSRARRPPLPRRTPPPLAELLTAMLAPAARRPPDGRAGRRRARAGRRGAAAAARARAPPRRCAPLSALPSGAC